MRITSYKHLQQSLEMRKTSSSGRPCNLRCLKSPILDLQILLQCWQEVPDGRRCEDVETSPSHVSSAVSPPHEVELSQIWPLPAICNRAKVDGPWP